MEDTIFDKILRKEIPANIVYEDEDVLAFHDIHPQAPVHVLVIPKKKRTGVQAFPTASPAEIGTYMIAVAKVATQLGLDAEGYRVVFNQGHNGQQTVAYVHAHILGGRQMAWPPG
jgi:histidine triad (HIT) family protein